MSFDMSKAPAVVRLAWDHLLAQARVSPVILRLCVEATYETEPARGIHLEADYPYRTPWGWPVLDMDSSVGTLAQALTELQEVGVPKSLNLVLQRGGAGDAVIFDFLAGTTEQDSEPEPAKWVITNLDEVLNSVVHEELHPNQCVAVVAPDMTLSFSEDLSRHMMYALDGSADVLWIGASAGNGCDPDTLSTATARACTATGRSEDVMLVSGDIVDLGDGWVILRHPHRIAMLDIQKEN